jgi:hypothetical protein
MVRRWRRDVSPSRHGRGVGPVHRRGVIRIRSLILQKVNPPCITGKT